jgi:hypothetical protein
MLIAVFANSGRSLGESCLADNPQTSTTTATDTLKALTCVSSELDLKPDCRCCRERNNTRALYDIAKLTRDLMVRPRSAPPDLLDPPSGLTHNCACLGSIAASSPRLCF